MREQHASFIAEEQDGRHFGNYDLESRIDIGGMGEVYLARQRTAFGRYVAIKIIRSDLVHDRTARERFLREAEVSAHLKHEHILPLFEFGEMNGRLFYVTPYIEGGTLARRLRNGPLSLPEVRQLFSALVQAVAYIHRRGVIHRDLKPSNILLDIGSDGQIYIRLIDFGIASIQGRAASPPLTETGTEVGTVAYMAPERLSGVAAPSNDIYSLGIILYQMLTGLTPNAGQQRALVRPLEYIVQYCVAPRPEDRFATADDLLKAFESACQYLLSPRSTAPVSSPVPPVLPRPVTGDIPIVSINRLSTPPHPGGNPGQEVKTLQRSEDMPPSHQQPQPMDTFRQEDYDAPTTAFDASPVQSRQGVDLTPTARDLPRPPRRPFKLSPLTSVTVLIVIVLLAIAGLLFETLQVTTSATVSFSAQASSISKVFQITAKPSVKKVDVATASIPASALVTSKTGSQTGKTTGESFDASCFCFKHSVSQDDQNTLVEQLKKTLDPQVSQDLQAKLQAQGGTGVSQPFISEASDKTNPPVGSVSETVTVTLTEQGSVEYFLGNDAKQLARQLLMQEAQKQGANFTLVSSTIQIGRPVVIGVDATGIVTLKIAAAGVSQYQFSSSELADIKNHIKGMKSSDARTYLQGQSGVDPHSVSIRLTVGDTLPSDTQHITITTTSNALPPVQLSPVSGSSTASPNTTPAATAAP